jgi:hypothetical protein
VPVNCRRADSSVPDPGVELTGIGLFIGVPVAGGVSGPGVQPAVIMMPNAAPSNLRIEHPPPVHARVAFPRLRPGHGDTSIDGAKAPEHGWDGIWAISGRL